MTTNTSLPFSVRLDASSLDTLFLEARTQNKWLPQPVPEALLRELYGLARMAPTMGNGQPMRLVFIRTPEAKARLAPLLSPGNVDKTNAAPVTAIVAHDLTFYEQLPTLMPQAAGFRDRFAAMPATSIEQMAFQGSSMQGAYLIIAARSLGLDCGPMGGFDHAGVDREFLAGTEWRSNFLLNLGYGDPAGVFPRNPRLTFDDACRIV